jgi:hypothetical protein
MMLKNQHFVHTQQPHKKQRTILYLLCPNAGLSQPREGLKLHGEDAHIAALGSGQKRHAGVHDGRLAHPGKHHGLVRRARIPRWDRGNVPKHYVICNAVAKKSQVVENMAYYDICFRVKEQITYSMVPYSETSKLLAVKRGSFSMNLLRKWYHTNLHNNPRGLVAPSGFKSILHGVEHDDATSFSLKNNNLSFLKEYSSQLIFNISIHRTNLILKKSDPAYCTIIMNTRFKNTSGCLR